MFFRLAITTLLVFLAAPSAQSDERQPESSKAKVETLYTGLDHPCGIAVQPKTGDLFVSNTSAGQVVKFSANKPSTPAVVITDFAHESAAQPNVPWTLAGPLGLAFLDENLLAVGTGEAKNGQQTIGVFALAADSKPIQFKDAKQVLTPISAAENSLPGTYNLYALATVGTPTSAIYSTIPGFNERNWLIKADVRKNLSLDALRLLYPAKPGGASIAITVNPRGLLVIGRSGTIGQTKDSSISFHDAKSGAKLGGFATGLNDIVSLAYSPESHMLYAAEFGSANATTGGVYRIDAAIVDGVAGAKATKIAAIEHPTAITFGADHVMYVTTFGNQPKSGKLIRITGDL